MHCPAGHTTSETNMNNHNLGEGAEALMIESNKADLFLTMPLHMGISDAKSVDKVISAAEAVKIFSEGVSKEVEFVIDDLEFVYYCSDRTWRLKSADARIQSRSRLETHSL